MRYPKMTLNTDRVPYGKRPYYPSGESTGAGDRPHFTVIEK